MPIAGADAALRAVALGTVPVLALAHLLTPFGYASPAGQVAPVLTSRAALVFMASRVGSALGGPLVAVPGALHTLLWPALTTVGLASVASLAPVGARARAPTGTRPGRLRSRPRMHVPARRGVSRSGRHRGTSIVRVILSLQE